MGFFEWIVLVVVALVVVIGIMFMVSQSTNATSYQDTFGNSYENQTNGTIQAAKGVAEGSGSAASGILLFMAVIVLVGVPIGFAFAKRPKW